MIYRLADNITSPLGETSEANFVAVRRGESALMRYERPWGLPESYVLSLFSEERRRDIQQEGHSFFESLVIYSITQALSKANIDVASERTILILSTTKGDVGQLRSTDTDFQKLYLGETARKIAREIGVRTKPVVVCNACISGLGAIILADRLLTAGEYDNAIVCGADVLNPFIVTGFNSFKALSAEECRPFDIERLGLNLGEAAATIVFGRSGGEWAVGDGYVRNDAVHISNPSNKGEGLYRALKHVVNLDEDYAFVNAHGTGTMFNDQMESQAIKRVSLTDVPVNGFKGYYGHTLGASGVLETILCIYSAEEGVVLGTRGFSELGVSVRLAISGEERKSEGQSFLKMLSGFGGCNAAVKGSKLCSGSVGQAKKRSVLRRTHTVCVTPVDVVLDGQHIPVTKKGDELLTEIYKTRISDYPKYYKMDMLSRLGFVASELLLEAEGKERFVESEDRAVILFNRSSSIQSDKKYLTTIEDPDNYYPSPSVFVYTLPNIVTGEIAIRNNYHGETSFYILPQRDDVLIESLYSSVIDDATCSVVGGWLDYEGEDGFLAEMSIFEIEN